MVLIFRDCDALPGRLDTLQEAFPGPVFHVCPHHMAEQIPTAIPIEIPAAWLPTHQPTRARAEWWAADALGLAAVRQLAIDSPHVWFAESDIFGPVAKWREVFQATAASPDDGIFAKLMPRAHPFARSMKHWLHAPEWASHAHLMTLYRLSARAIQWTTADIAGLREFYSETRCASGIVRRGGSVRNLREFLEYSAPRAFTGHVSSHCLTPGVLNHPVKQ